MRAPVGRDQRGAQHGQMPGELLHPRARAESRLLSDAYHAKGLLKSAVRDDNPVLVFEHKLLYGSKGREMAGGIDLTADVPQEEYLVPIGKAVVKRPGERRHRRRHARQPLPLARGGGGVGGRGRSSAR